MSQNPPPNVKIYDRPQRKGLSPMLLALLVLALAVAGYFGYRAYANARAVAPPPPPRVSIFGVRREATTSTQQTITRTGAEAPLRHNRSET